MKRFIGLLVLASVSMAEPIKYNLVDSSDPDLSGYIIWDSAAITTNADLTLGNATEWSFTSSTGGATDSTWSTADGVLFDTAGWSGVFGITDLTPTSDLDWFESVGTAPVVWWFDGVVIHLEDTNTLDIQEYYDIKLKLASTPVPEPGSLTLVCVALAGGLVWRRRRRSKQSS